MFAYTHKRSAQSRQHKATGVAFNVHQGYTHHTKTAVGGALFAGLFLLWSQEPPGPAGQTSSDAVQEALRSMSPASKRPEQTKTPHDQSDRFDATKADPTSPSFKTQPKQGKISGFDFYRDPLNAVRPFVTPEEIMKKEIAAKPGVTANQRKLLESRYNLTPKLHPSAQNVPR
jgi:hypothetical protein